MPIYIKPVSELLTLSFPETDGLLGNLLDRSGSVVVSGPQKIGKSLFSDQLAFCLADNQQFVGHRTGGNYRSLVLQAEVSERRMQERLARQAAMFSPESHERVLHACVFSSVKLDTEEGAATLIGWVDEYRPDLIVIDPLCNFHGGDENVAKDMLKVTAVLDSVRQRGPAVVVVHHHGKRSTENTNVGYKARGSSALAGWYDSHLSLEWAQERTVRLRYELRNDETPEDVLLRLNHRTLLFEVQTGDAAQVELVVSAVRDAGPASADTVADACHRTRQWASEWLNRAVEIGRLHRQGTRPVLFSLPEQATLATVTVNPEGIVVNTNTQTQPIAFGEQDPFRLN